jgi:hypothetical protein
MNVKIEQLDLNKTREHWPQDRSFQPALVINRKQDKHKWVVLSSPLVSGQPPAWSYTEHDEFVRVPLFPYRLNHQGHLALAYMLQLGLSCAGYLPAPVTDFYVVTGNPVELLVNPDTEECAGMRYWVGFAIVTE